MRFLFRVYQCEILAHFEFCTFVGSRWHFYLTANRHQSRFDRGCIVRHQWTHDWHNSLASNRPFLSHHHLHSAVKHSTARGEQECFCSIIILCSGHARGSVHYYLRTRDIGSVGTDTCPRTATGFNCTGKQDNFISSFLHQCTGVRFIHCLGMNLKF